MITCMTRIRVDYNEMRDKMKEKLLGRFFNYVMTETTSNEESETCPSTEGQLNLARHLTEEMKQIGLSDVSMDENGYVMGFLPSNIDRKVPTIGFIAHMDTAPDASGKNVNPIVYEEYDGEDIVLNEEHNIVMKVSDFPELKEYVGQDLIVTDGTTLLGADDKAGVAEIMTAIEYLITHPEIPHGKICIGFTPDEEIGRGADRFNVQTFGADFAYTIDGGPVGELEYENFNAASAKIRIQGLNVHPGSAKNKMVNSQLIAMELHGMLPVFERPEYTENYEGFYLLTSIKGEVEETSMSYIIRDHHKEAFEKKKRLLIQVVDFLNQKYGNIVNLTIKDSYYNMKEKVEPCIEIIELAKRAMIEVGLEPNIVPIRGGTDGSRLSFEGLPCPNIFTGGMNYHGKFEYIPIPSMLKATEVILKIIELNAK